MRRPVLWTGVILWALLAVGSALLPTALSAPGHIKKQPAKPLLLAASESADKAKARPAPSGSSLHPWQSLFKRNYADLSLIEDFLDSVHANPDIQRTILLENTLSWGCPCPTWVFPFYQDMSRLQYVMILPAPALTLDPTDFAAAGIPFRMTGHFNGSTLTGLEWVKQRGKAPPNFPKDAAQDDPVIQEYWAEPGLVFIVEHWCFDSEALDENLFAEDMQWLHEHGAESCH